MNLAEPFSLDADANQARASDPGASAWVSANAGTGKTEVLVRRVLRLLLADARPECVLCLTYTKTAAAEMQNRLLKQLGEWATDSDQALRAKLETLMQRRATSEEMRKARQLFASVLEAKGGLKIYTIHGFCERLLQRFPLEAGITPNFSVLEEREQKLLLNAAIDATIAAAAKDRGGMLGRALANIVALNSEAWFRQTVVAVLAKRIEIELLVAYHDSASDWPEAEKLALKRAFGVADLTEQDLLDDLAAVLGDGDIDSLVAAIAECAATSDDQRLLLGLQTARTVRQEARADALRSIFRTGDGKPRSRLCSKRARGKAPQLCAMLDDAQARFTYLSHKLAALRIAEASGALLALADAIQTDYQRRKAEQAKLDYDDLIIKSLHLLGRAGAAEWVLFKIDGGIDHILVDEAQDTNPDQWTIVERLAEEFFAGKGASEHPRTLFAVGDEKQSIYSFQGANPARFGEIGRAFRQKAARVQHSFHDVPLTLSFRSVSPILEAVDHIFATAAAAQGLRFEETTVIEHHAYRKGQPGLVEIWDTEKEEKPEPADPFEPWRDEGGGARSVNALAERIAKLIKHWLASGEPLDSQARRMRAGDILILVRRREPFIAPMIRMLKHEKIPVAGADRMRLMDQLAVQDLVALADWLLMPGDDLTLAVVLKSPLFGFNDQDLFALAYDRTAPLWSELRRKGGEDIRFAEAAENLTALLSRADLLPPYEFFSELLGRGQPPLRERMLTRLGPEAADAIDEFLDLALAYDRDAAPSLQGFLNELRIGDVAIKRDMEQDRDEVRIMTVHGAKGLQAPVVFLPDTCMRSRTQGPKIHKLARAGLPPDTAPHLAWAPTGHSAAAVLEEAKAIAEQAEREEYHRLLYVAMTRAQDRLYICGWHGQRENPEKGCWYQLVKEGLQGRLSEAKDYKDRPVWRIELKRKAGSGMASAEDVASISAVLPDWARIPAGAEHGRRELVPSRLGGTGFDAKSTEQPPLGPSALGAGHRFARGRLVHALLQYLPEVPAVDRGRVARAFVAARGAELDASLREEIVGETLAIVDAPRFAPLFGPGSVAEVPVVARIGDGEDAVELSGQIDRLAVAGDELLILDYKTNRPPPSAPDEVAEAYVAQLAAYRTALRLIYPGKAIRAALLWTDGPKLMEIPSNLLDAAEQEIVVPQAQP